MNNEVSTIKEDLARFQAYLNREPNSTELERTPDGKASYLPISFIEMTLDELFLGLWSTENFKWAAIGNEVQGCLELVVTHPITGKELRRSGAGSIVIMVDALSSDEKTRLSKQQINLYALDPSNKKSNALDMAFPKLQTECVKNAAKSLGKIFGRDLNRKKTDVFKSPIKARTIEINTLDNADKVRRALAAGQINDHQATELITALTK